MKVVTLRRLDKTCPVVRLETPFVQEDCDYITPAFRVCVRIKPFLDSEKMRLQEQEGFGMLDRNYQFDEVFEEHAVNQEVYRGTLQPLIK
jgi:hypothetical protein